MIGNSSAAAKLDIRQDSGYAIRAENGSGHYFRVAATGQVEITNNAVDGTASLLLNCTEDSALASPILEFNRDTGSTADADYLGRLNLQVKTMPIKAFYMQKLQVKYKTQVILLKMV